MKWKYTRVPILAAAVAAFSLMFSMPSLTTAAISAPTVIGADEPGGLEAVFGIQPELASDHLSSDFGDISAALTGGDNGPAPAPAADLVLLASGGDLTKEPPAPERDVINKTDQAMGQAMGSLVLVPGAAGIGVGVGYGTFEGEHAFAAGVSFTPLSAFTVKGTTAVSADGDLGAGVSVGLSF